MKISLVQVKNIFSIIEKQIDGKSIEITGKNGVGKTSLIDALKYGLTNDSSRDYIVRNGETEGEILIETDTGLSINRKKRIDKSDYKSIKENGKEIPSPESFLNQLFTPMQLNPIEFIQMPRQEQNRIILDLIQFDWDLNWIREKFGEIPPDVDFKQNILEVLNDIQSEKGTYYKERQLANSALLHGKKTVFDIAESIPEGYQADKWEKFQTAPKYEQLEKIKVENGKIERAKLFKESYSNKIRGFEADRDIAISAEEKAIANERQMVLSTIERLKAELVAEQDKLSGFDSKLSDKKALAVSKYNEQVAKLDSEIQDANGYADKEPQDTATLQSEISTAEAMKLHLNEYRRMVAQQERNSEYEKQSEEYTRKIEIARELPSEILKTATIPVEGLTVKDGIPLINGMPVSNLSEGEKLSLCVDVAISKPNALQIILIDGAEKLCDKNRLALYAKCKDKGLQFIATRTTNDDELEVTEL